MITKGLAGLDGTHHRLCVIGAGPVGLSLALELERTGHRVLLL
jgi:2-polyprenyl-6-methoxyphenol hydroxylase-like FAD-dependent oxidoreductase